MCIAKTLIMKSLKFEDPTNTPSGEKPEVKAKLKLAHFRLKLCVYVVWTLIIKSGNFEGRNSTPSGQKPEVKSKIKIAQVLLRFSTYIIDTLVNLLL